MRKLVFVTSLIICLSLVLLPASGCGPKTDPTANSEYWPTQDWRTSSPEDQGMDSAKLEEMMTAIKDGAHGVDSVIVVRHGYIVWEEYPNDFLYDKDTAHFLASVTKSFTSALIGIAIDKGYLKGVDQKIVDLFPDVTIANLDERKQMITIENLLMMTAGWEWDELSYGYSDTRNSLTQAAASGNMSQYVLDLPMQYEPGERFVYNTGSTQVLSAIITRATGMSTDEFARQYLFEPLGITSADWKKDAQGIASGGSYLNMTPRDMARFGYLFLHNGVWNGKQIVPAAWVEKSTGNIRSNYGYLWWVNPTFEYYSAAGALGQRIFVSENEDLLFIVTTSREESNFVSELFIANVLDAIIKQ